MGLSRRWLRKLERKASEDMESFELIDGSVYTYDRLETFKELYLHGYDLLLGDAHKWPQPPEIYLKICQAKDVAAVLERFLPEHAFVDMSEIYDLDALVNERRLVPIYHPPVEDLSEQAQEERSTEAGAFVDPIVLLEDHDSPDGRPA